MPISQEDSAKHVLARLDTLGPGDCEFDDLLAKFIPATRDHIDDEESQVWPQLRQVLSAAEAEDLGSKVADAKKTAPTRPRPHTPTHPGALRARSLLLSGGARARAAARTSV